MNILNDIFGIEVEYDLWNGQDCLPLYITGSYEFQTAVFNGYRCVVISPKEDLPTLPALKKQIQRIQKIEPVPVVLKLVAISAFRRKNMIEGRIPFVTNTQVYLPFMGTYLQKENAEPKEVKKFMFSTQQLFLLYLYENQEKLYISHATEKLPFTAMTISRAVKQLETTDLFQATKDGVNKVIEAKYGKRELFERAKEYLSSPVRTVGYILKENLTRDMVMAGDSALAEKTMLNPSKLETYAVYAKKFDKGRLMNELVDPAKQCRLELWEYEPQMFADGHTADDVSIALTFLHTADERIEEATEELLENILGEHGK